MNNESYNDFPATSPQDDVQSELHLMDYVAVVLQRWPIALGIFVLVAVLTVLFVWTRTPRYTATCRLLVEPRGINLTAMQEVYDQGGGRIAVWSGEAVYEPTWRRSRYEVLEETPAEWADVFDVSGGAALRDTAAYAGEDGTLRIVRTFGTKGIVISFR